MCVCAYIRISLYIYIYISLYRVVHTYLSWENHHINPHVLKTQVDPISARGQSLGSGGTAICSLRSPYHQIKASQQLSPEEVQS